MRDRISMKRIVKYSSRSMMATPRSRDSSSSMRKARVAGWTSSPHRAIDDCRNAKWDRKTGVADEFDRLARELQGDSTTQANTVMKKVEDKKQKKLQEKRRK